MTYRIGLIDDSQLDIDVIKKELENYHNYEVFGYTSFHNLKDSKRSYDILFLDIEMPEINGIQLAKKIKEMNNVPIVFLSWHEGYVFHSFSVHPLYFVRKEHLAADLKLCMVEVNKMLSKEKIFEFIYQYEKHIITISSIVFINIKNRVTQLHMANSKIQVCRIPLKSIIQEDGFEDFVLISSDMMVNMNYIDRIHDVDCILKTGKCLDISYRKKKVVYQNFIDFLKMREKI